MIDARHVTTGPGLTGSSHILGRRCVVGNAPPTPTEATVGLMMEPGLSREGGAALFDI